MRQFVEYAFAEVGRSIQWEGKGLDEKGVDDKGNVRVEVDPRYFRPTEVETLLGDPTKAKTKLGWEPKITFEEMVKEMVRDDLQLAKRDEHSKAGGFNVYQYYE